MVPEPSPHEEGCVCEWCVRPILVRDEDGEYVARGNANACRL